MREQTRFTCTMQELRTWVDTTEDVERQPVDTTTLAPDPPAALCLGCGAGLGQDEPPLTITPDAAIFHPCGCVLFIEEAS